MSVKKLVDVIYVAAMPKELSGIGMDVPAHVKLEYIGDELGRRHSHFLQLTDEQIAFIANLPDKVKPAIVSTPIPGGGVDVG